ncbi:MAG: molybdopterin-dependent oxidoreductase Mo/Fe-S-binding subunit [Spirochaetia bacterium]|nr:molybdopterin-dependent oxidoreductase Mo/Fe-S-binding subunit [Spirochaetia bacterium]
MNITFTLNGVSRSVDTAPGESLQKFLQRLGFSSVRNSDDRYGFTGSDTILFDHRPVNAGLMVTGQISGHTIDTIESLAGAGNSLSAVQSALIDAGVVQSGYNAPAAALLLTDLLNRIPDPSREEIQDAFSGLYNRATGYQQFFTAVEIAKSRIIDPQHSRKVSEEFRPDLRIIGKNHRKIDGQRLVQGERAFVEDMVTQGSLVLKLLHSPHAHAYIREIDTTRAEQLPGVVLVLTYKNVPDVYYTPAGQGFPEPSPYDRRMFARKLYHIGDRVAGVVAVDEQTALKALSCIDVTYDELTPIFTIDEAEAPDAPIIHKAHISYAVGAPDTLDADNAEADPRDGRIEIQFPIGADPHRNKAASVSGSIGDIEQGFAQANTVIERTYTTTQVQCTPCETHVVFTRMEGGRLIIHASTQVPWHVRRITARVLGISENKIRVIKERVGGGYGSKQEILLEEVCAYATWITGKPVYFHFTREEEYTCSVSRFPMKIRVKLGAKKDGTFTAMYMDLKANTGPFGNHCLTVPMNGCSKSLPLFLCDNIAFDVNVFYSNCMPTGAYQGYGAPKANYALQMAVAELAEQLQMDPLALVEKNRVDEGVTLEILRCLGEGREGSPEVITSCGLAEAVRQGAQMIEWGKTETSKNPLLRIGKGMAIVQQGSGLPGLDHSNAEVKLESDGSVIVHSGGADIGTGFDTLCAKTAAEVLMMDTDLVAVVTGDTDSTPFDSGAFASSGTYFSGGAVFNAAVALRQKIITAAAQLLGEAEDEITITYPQTAAGKTGSVTFAQIAHQSQSGEGSGHLIGTASFTCEKAAFPYGAHFAQVSVNTESGEIRVEKYYALQDCGTPLNPELAEGQIYGGVLKAIGHTLFEELILDEQGKCLTTDLETYGIPMINDIPDDFRVKLIETCDPHGPFGSKSVSEISMNGAAPAIANAVHDATGIWIRDWPITPEKVLKALGTY